MKIIESNLQFKSLSNLGTVKRIILHHAEAKHCSIHDIHQWHLNNGWSGCGYHFLVRKDGTIYRGRPEDKLGAHTSNHNTGSLGICFEGAYNTETMNETQIKAGQELIVYLLDKYKLLKANVYKHKDFNSTDCPGNNFPYETLRSGAKNETVIVKSIEEELREECKKQGFDSYPVCRKGAKGNITKIIQRLLISKGYSLPIYGADGSYGDETVKAVKSFQTKNGLLVDGVVGQETWKALLK